MAHVAAAQRHRAELRRRALAEWDSSYLASGDRKFACCPRGHALEGKATSSFNSEKVCSRCNSGFFYDEPRHSCRTCNFHLCSDCLNAASRIWRWEKRSLGSSCPAGHTLQQRECAGGFSVEKECARCGEKHGMAPGCVRHSCKTCAYHLCQPCYMSTIRTAVSQRQARFHTRGSCPFGHSLTAKVVDGSHSLFGISPPKECRVCNLRLVSGMTRHSCTTCDYHLCQLCKAAKSSPSGEATAKANATVSEARVKAEHLKQHSLWELFQLYDESKSSYLSRDEFRRSHEELRRLFVSRGVQVDSDVQSGWIKAGGKRHGFVNFVGFSSWVQSLGLHLKVGLEIPHSSHVLSICVPTMDRRSQGLIEVNNLSFLNDLQTWLSGTHKVDDNWTRDRGCAIHGVNGCNLKCASSNRMPVPTGFVVRKVLCNQNIGLWQRYRLARSAILASCKSSTSSSAPFTAIPVATATDGFLNTSDASVKCDPLSADCNEWRLLHGCSFESAKRICKDNFDLSMAGTGATWKEHGASRGMPLYGRHAAYFAERVTKADEYSTPLREEQGGIYCMLIARCTAGKPRVLTDSSYDKDGLVNDVLRGPFHSVLGDRCSVLGKPYRELAMYDPDQIYPEFLVLYERAYEKA